MRILPIETDPYVKAFTYHSYPLSILGSNRYCGEKKAEISILESVIREWEFYTNDVYIDYTKNDYIISGNKYADNVEARIYREADVVDEIIVKVNYIQYTQPYGYISIFLSNKETFDNTDMYYKIGVYNKGDVFSGSDQEFRKCNNISCTNSSYYMKLERKKDYINYWLSFDSEEWILISGNYLLNYDNKQKFYIGINLFLGENQYYNWLFTNYIQLYGRNVFTSEYFVDYFVTPEKDGNFYTVHSLLDYCIMDKSILKESGVDIIQFIKVNINKGKYVDFALNEYYLEGTSAYGNNVYYHANLIYGYDDIGVYILGYDKGGYLKARRFVYADFLKSIDNNMNTMCVYSFVPLEAYFKLNINTIKRSLYEYWKGMNTNLGIDFILPKGERNITTTFINPNKDPFSDNLPEFLNIYGIQIYNLFLNNEIMFNYLLKDIRIPFIFYEHKKIMKDRILYLQQKKHIKDEYINKILTDTDTLLNNSYIFMNICLKYRMTLSNETKIIVKEKLEKLKDLEEKYYPELLESLY